MDISRYGHETFKEMKKKSTKDLLKEYAEMKKKVDYEHGKPENPYWWEKFEAIELILRDRNVL